jgi:hypothetical protein
MCFLQLVLLLKQIRNVTRGACRRPFIILTVLILALGIGYIAGAFAIRLSTEILLVVSVDTVNSISFVDDFFYFINSAFLPIVPLSLIHVRGSALRSSQGTTFDPLMSRKWKKIFDWALVGLNYILSIVYFSLLVYRISAFNHDEIDEETDDKLATHSTRLYDAILAFKLASCLDVIISSIIMFVQTKKQSLTDPVCFPFLPHL